MDVQQPSIWPKFHCVVGGFMNIYTWAVSAEAAQRQVAAFEDVPLHFVVVQPLGAA